MLKPFPSVPCLRPAEMGKSAEQMYRQLPCLSAHAMELWVHIICLLRNQKAPCRRGGRKHNRRSLQLSERRALSDSDYIAIAVEAFFVGLSARVSLSCLLQGMSRSANEVLLRMLQRLVKCMTAVLFFFV